MVWTVLAPGFFWTWSFLAPMPSISIAKTSQEFGIWIVIAMYNRHWDLVDNINLTWRNTLRHHEHEVNALGRNHLLSVKVRTSTRGFQYFHKLILCKLVIINGILLEEMIKPKNKTISCPIYYILNLPLFINWFIHLQIVAKGYIV